MSAQSRVTKPCCKVYKYDRLNARGIFNYLAKERLSDQFFKFLHRLSRKLKSNPIFYSKSLPESLHDMTTDDSNQGPPISPRTVSLRDDTNDLEENKICLGNSDFEMKSIEDEDIDTALVQSQPYVPLRFSN